PADTRLQVYSMERYQQHRTASISRALPLQDRGRAVQADQEDGTAEIIIKPHIRGVFCLWEDG
ncbi:MAG: hypothetical protein QF380_08930, partial [Candidatus Marinimicrobia bacterium]|nr:hypothetical protein [Candidatus Neomarinimicrobiota bacterium]